MKRYMRYELLAFFMSLIMMVSMISSAVYAEGLITLDGKLKIKGDSIIGTELQPDYEELITKDFTEQNVKFSWMRTSLEEEEKAELEQVENLTREEVGTEPTYTLKEADLGYIIILRITGIEETGYTGILEAKSDIISEPVMEEPVMEPVEELTPESVVEEPAPEPVIEEPEPESVVEEPAPEPVIEESEPESVVEEPEPESVVEEPAPEPAEELIPESAVEEPVPEQMEDNLGITEIFVEESTFQTDETGVEDVIYSIETNLEENTVDFGVFVSGQENELTPKSVVLKNTGTGDIEIVLPELPNFVITKLNQESPDILTAGSQIEYLVTPIAVEGLEAGYYVNEIMLGVEEKAVVKVLAAFEVKVPELTEEPVEPTPEPTEEPVEPTPEPTEEPVEPTPEPTEEPAEPTPEPTEEPIEPTPEPTPTPELVIAVDIQPASHNFGAKETGYGSAPDAQYITVMNSGNVPLNLIQPMGEYYDVSTLSTNVLQSDESISFTVRPKEGLGKGEYYEMISVETMEGVSQTVELNFVVTSKTVKLQGIEQPADITGLANGVKKNEKGLKLPATVMISTTKGNMSANVTWDLESCEYNRKSVKAQAFTVTGTVMLPEGIKNPNNISLNVTVNVTVKAYSPKIADASQNGIAGISENSYTTQSKITFTAVGAGMDNEAPRKGDVRYCPASWGVFNTNTWKSASYTATFGMGQAGDYTLTVTYNKQQFDGDGWINTGETDKKTVSFKVVKAEESVSLTPSAEEKDINQKEAVATGDTTMILPLVAALVLALVCVIVILVYRKKR